MATIRDRFISQTVLKLLMVAISEDTGEKRPQTIYDLSSGKKPNVSFDEYYNERLVQYINLQTKEYASLLLAFAIVIRLTVDTQLSITKTNIYRLFGTALVLAHKYLNDRSFLNSYYARVIGITVEELNKMERDMLTRLNGRVSTECSVDIIKQIIPDMPRSLDPQAFLDELAGKLKPKQISDGIRACRRQQLLEPAQRGQAAPRAQAAPRGQNRLLDISGTSRSQATEYMPHPYSDAMAPFAKRGTASMVGTPVPQQNQTPRKSGQLTSTDSYQMQPFVEQGSEQDLEIEEDLRPSSDDDQDIDDDRGYSGVDV
jgi:hypothetical protein